jgi:hypothetical protein
MPASEVDLTDYRSFFFCKLQFLWEIISISLGRDAISQKVQGVGAKVSVAPASRRLLAVSLTSSTAVTIRHISTREMNPGFAR